MSDDDKNETTQTAESEEVEINPDPETHNQDSNQSGPTFTKGPDPLASVRKGAAKAMASVRKGAAKAMASMEGKSVSMKVYVATIVGVFVLMLLARCGG